MKLALVTCDEYAVSSAAEDDWYVQNILLEDELLSSGLSKLGCQTQRVSWSDPHVDWAKFDRAVIRSTWDYFHRFAEFSHWLEQVANQTRLCNPLALVRWNVDKHYLADLVARGLPVVPSVFIEAGSSTRLIDLMEERGLHQAVIKPCVSGAARHTYRLDRDTAHSVDQQIATLRQCEAFLLQPFMPAIMSEGEDTLVMAGDQFTHAIRKRAKSGDFRVQDDHGGTVASCHASEEQIELAGRAIRACQSQPAYGRVDMVRDENAQWLIMELELIEPELWMRFDPSSADTIAAAITRWE